MRNENGDLMMTRQDIIVLSAISRDYADSVEKISQGFKKNTHLKKVKVSKEIDELTKEFIDRLTDFFNELDK